MKPGSDYVWGGAVAGAALAIGLLLVTARTEDGQNPWLALSPDARQYVAMAEHRDAAPPFASRRVVPYLASLLPGRATTGLRLVSYASLFATYTAALVLLRSRGFSRPVSLLALSCVFASTNHLLLYQNPHLPEAFALLCLTLMMRALLERRFGWFAGVAVVGVLARETCVFLLPALAVRRRWGWLALSLVLGAVALALSRSWPEAYAYYQPVGSPWSLRFAAQVFLSWGALWVVILSGVGLLMRAGEWAVVASFACLAVGAALTSLKAYDVMRMFTLLTPVALLATAAHLQELGKRSRAAVITLVVSMLGNVLVAFPETLLTGSAGGMKHLEEFYRAHRWEIAAMQGTALACALASVYALARRSGSIPLRTSSSSS